MSGYVECLLATVSGPVAYLLVCLVPALEASVFVGFLVPGETAVLLGGVLAAEGYASLTGMIVAAIGGAILGDSVGTTSAGGWAGRCSSPVRAGTSAISAGEFSRANGRQWMTREQIRSLAHQLGDIVLVLRNADARDKAEIYAQLGLTLTYQHNERLVVVESRPDAACTKQRVRGGTPPLGTPALRTVLAVIAA